jgi:hypothetical protein
MRKHTVYNFMKGLWDTIFRQTLVVWSKSVIISSFGQDSSDSSVEQKHGSMIICHICPEEKS